eukprot:125525-Lingulodinium_polyedra.AAC.1
MRVALEVSASSTSCVASVPRPTCTPSDSGTFAPKRGMKERLGQHATQLRPSRRLAQLPAPSIPVWRLRT